jgi:hypothetical protein
MSAAPRRRRNSEDVLDVDLIDLPAAARWREWMLRVEAAIFASARPVSREALVRLERPAVWSNRSGIERTRFRGRSGAVVRWSPV